MFASIDPKQTSLPSSRFYEIYETHLTVTLMAIIIYDQLFSQVNKANAT